MTMTRPSHCLLALALLASCAESVAQSYEFGQKNGYIFEQKYVTRISKERAEQLIGSRGYFEPLLSAPWGKEVIRDSGIRRTGDRLILQFPGRPPLSLRDYFLKETSDSEGDLQTFRYLKSERDLHVVGIEFGHDGPAFLLVSRSGSEIYFVNTN